MNRFRMSYLRKEISIKVDRTQLISKWLIRITITRLYLAAFSVKLFTPQSTENLITLQPQDNRLTRAFKKLCQKSRTPMTCTKVWMSKSGTGKRAIWSVSQSIRSISLPKCIICSKISRNPTVVCLINTWLVNTLHNSYQRGKWRGRWTWAGDKNKLIDMKTHSRVTTSWQTGTSSSWTQILRVWSTPCVQKLWENHS